MLLKAKDNQLGLSPDPERELALSMMATSAVDWTPALTQRLATCSPGKTGHDLPVTTGNFYSFSLKCLEGCDSLTMF